VNPPTDWEAHYRANDTPWDHGGPVPGLVDFLAANPTLERGPVVVPGCGMGHDARGWAASGFETVGLDLAPSAVVAARQRTPEGMSVEFRTGDFLSDEPIRPFRWMFEHTLFCAIDPSLRGAYAKAAGRWVEPGGWLVAVHYLNPASPEGPPHRCERAELMELFGSEFELLSEWTPRSWENRQGREGMFWWRRRVTA
jgi:hypothetical protein